MASTYTFPSTGPVCTTIYTDSHEPKCSTSGNFDQTRFSYTGSPTECSTGDSRPQISYTGSPTGSPGDFSPTGPACVGYNGTCSLGSTCC